MRLSTALWSLWLAVPAASQPSGVAPTANVRLMTRDPSQRWIESTRTREPPISQPAKSPPAESAPAPPKPAAGAPAVAPALAAPAPATDAHANISVKGLKGTLNKDDVHQAMEARQVELDACITRSRRSVRWVSGAIRFGCKVDGEGKVAELRTVASTLGHRELERCMSAVVLTTQFPKPSGRAVAEFSWGLAVEPAGARPLDSASPKLVARVLRKQAPALFRTCELRRRRARFQVTAYLSSEGRIFSAGAVPVPARFDDKVDCVLEQLSKWSLPKPKHASKLSFELR